MWESSSDAGAYLQLWADYTAVLFGIHLTNQFTNPKIPTELRLGGWLMITGPHRGPISVRITTSTMLLQVLCHSSAYYVPIQSHHSPATPFRSIHSVYWILTIEHYGTTTIRARAPPRHDSLDRRCAGLPSPLASLSHQQRVHQGMGSGRCP